MQNQKLLSIAQKIEIKYWLERLLKGTNSTILHTNLQGLEEYQDSRCLPLLVTASMVNFPKKGILETKNKLTES